MDCHTDKEIARLYKSGLSMKQTADCLNIGCSKIRSALKRQNIPRRSHRNSSQLLHLTKFGKEQCIIKDNLSEDEEKLRIAGTMLYWGEGTKSGNSVMFSNSDPQMIRVFLKFLREICRVDEKRLRILLHMYDNQDEGFLKDFWSESTDIPISQFSKTFYHQGGRGSYRQISPYGTVSLRYSDKNLLAIINNWINQYKMPA